MDNSEHIKRLFQRFLDNKCTQEEVRALLQYFDAGDNEVLLRSLIEKQSEIFSDATLSSDSLKPLLEKAYSEIQRSIAEGSQLRSTAVVPLHHRLWFKISAAAAIILFISSTAFYFLYQKNNKATAQNVPIIQPVKDIPPGINNAVLTLADGTAIVLDTAGNGALAQQGGMKVLKINGQIAYEKSGHNTLQSAPVYNTITTARGNQYQVVLADGSKVWLNAASSIRFPSSFMGNERKVEITGEAYFEVAKNPAKPFKVIIPSSPGPDSYRADRAEIVVLGTHFNVNTYPEEDDVRTTLLEGSVKINKGSETQMLTPGEQARLTSGAMTLKKNVDISQVIAWKDGFFVFSNADIKTIMRQVARWYDVEVNFEGGIPHEGYTGKVSRNVSLSKFLKVLELNGIHVKTEGRKITIGRDAQSDLNGKQ